MIPKSVMIVEEDFLISHYLRQLCEGLGYDVVHTARTARAASDMFRTNPVSHILMDVRLEGHQDGIDAAAVIHGEAPDTRVIFITGSQEPKTMRRIKAESPHAILIKPIEPDALQKALA